MDDERAIMHRIQYTPSLWKKQIPAGSARAHSASRRGIPVFVLASSDRRSAEGLPARVCDRQMQPWWPCRGAPVCAPVRGSNMLQRADTSVGPYRGAMLICILAGLRIMIACSGRGMPRPYKATMPTRTQERSVTWRSDLFMIATFTNTNMHIPGPGPQARCGKGVWWRVRLRTEG